MKIIEFFGIPGSGKTFLKEKLLLEFDKRDYKVYSYKKILEKFLPANEKNIFKYILLKFFFILRYKNFKKKSIKKFSKKKFHKKESFLFNFKKYFFKIYEKNIDEIFNNIKDRKFINLTSKLIKESEFSHNNKTIFQRWLKEELVAIYLAKKNRKRINFIIDSEGIIQRLFIYIYKKNNKNKIVKKYLKFCPIPHHLVVMKRKVFLKKKSINPEFEMNEQELFKNYDVINEILKKNKKIKIIYQNEINKIYHKFF